MRQSATNQRIEFGRQREEDNGRRPNRSVHFAQQADKLGSQQHSGRCKRRRGPVNDSNKKRNVNESLDENFRTKLRPVLLERPTPSSSSKEDIQCDTRESCLGRIPEPTVGPMLDTLRTSSGVSRKTTWQALVDLAQLDRTSYKSPSRQDPGVYISFRRSIATRCELIRKEILPNLLLWLKNPPPYKYASALTQNIELEGHRELTNSVEYDLVSSENESFNSAVAEWAILKQASNLIAQYSEYCDEVCNVPRLDQPIQRYEMSSMRKPLANILYVLVNLDGRGLSSRAATERERSSVKKETLHALGTLLVVCHRHGVDDLMSLSLKCGPHDTAELASVFIQFKSLQKKIITNHSLQQIKQSYWALKCAGADSQSVSGDLLWYTQSRYAACLAILLSNIENGYDSYTSTNKELMRLLRDTCLTEAKRINSDNSIDNVRRKRKRQKLVEKSWGIECNEGLLAAMALSTFGDAGLMTLADGCCEHQDPSVLSVAATSLSHMLMYSGLKEFTVGKSFHIRSICSKEFSSCDGVCRIYDSEHALLVPKEQYQQGGGESVTRAKHIQAYVVDSEKRQPAHDEAKSDPQFSIAHDDAYFWNNDIVSENTLNYWGTKRLNQTNTLNSPKARNLTRGFLDRNTSVLSRTMASQPPQEFDDRESIIRQNLNRTAASFDNTHPEESVVSIAGIRTPGTRKQKTRMYSRFNGRTFFNAISLKEDTAQCLLLLDTTNVVQYLAKCSEQTPLSNTLLQPEVQSERRKLSLSGKGSLLAFQQLLGLLGQSDLCVVRQCCLGLCDWPFSGLVVTPSEVKGFQVSISSCIMQFLQQVSSALSHDNDFYRYIYMHESSTHTAAEASQTALERWILGSINLGYPRDRSTFNQLDHVCDLWLHSFRHGPVTEARNTGIVAHKVLAIGLLRACAHTRDNADTCNASLRALANVPPPLLVGKDDWILDVIQSLLESRFPSIRSCAVKLCHRWFKFLLKLTACNGNKTVLDKIDNSDPTGWEVLQCSVVAPQMMELFKVNLKELCHNAHRSWKILYERFRPIVGELLNKGHCDLVTAASCLLCCGQNGLRFVIRSAREQTTVGNVRLASMKAIASEVPFEALEHSGRVDLLQECATTINNLTTDGNSRVRSCAMWCILKMYRRYKNDKLKTLGYDFLLTCLTKRLEDDDVEVANNAGRILAELNPHGSVILLDLLHRGKRPSSRAAAAHGLGFSSTESSRALFLALTDRNSSVRDAVSLALLWKGPSRIQKELSSHSRESLDSVISTIRFFESEYPMSSTLKALLRNIVSHFGGASSEDEENDAVSSTILGELERDDQEDTLFTGIEYPDEGDAFLDSQHPQEYSLYSQHAYGTATKASPRDTFAEQQQSLPVSDYQRPTGAGATSSSASTTTGTATSAAAAASGGSASRPTLLLPLEQLGEQWQRQENNVVGEPISPGGSV